MRRESGAIKLLKTGGVRGWNEKKKIVRKLVS